MKKHVYLLMVRNSPDAVFEDFEQAQKAGNAYLSWIGFQGPIKWTNHNGTSWSNSHYDHLSIWKYQLNKRWWEK